MADGGIQYKYGSMAQVLCDWVDTTNFIMVAGRGMAKSTVILARRTYRAVTLMPGAPTAIVANSYANLVNNIMPAVQNGWKLMGLIEGVHYVKQARPPQSWTARCSVIVDDWRYVYTFWNGSVLMLGSLDSPSLLAGKSVVHIFFDEAKYAPDVRVNRVMPILRGNALRYGDCHLYGGVTVTTDMPDVAEGEHDWFFRYAAEMDPRRIVRIVQAAAERNRLLLRIAKSGKDVTPAMERKLRYWDNALVKMRRGQTFFMNLSSFVNIDILTLDYAKRLYGGALELHDFLKSVMGMRPGLKRSARFYALFGDEHKYADGTASGEAAFSSRELRWLDADRQLDGGMDFGNMLSLVVAQTDGSLYRVHKDFYEIPPGWFRELADQFLAFFAAHRARTLNLYYDRAGNNFQRQGEDYATRIKDAIERDASGRRTGWTVALCSRHQAVLRQHAEYDFMHQLMGAANPALPRLAVDAVNCPELVASIEGARAEVKYRGTVKIVAKVKRTEKLAPAKLPRMSTNMSDAFKYLMMRRQWLASAQAQPAVRSDAGDLAEQWMRDRGKSPGYR